MKKYSILVICFTVILVSCKNKAEPGAIQATKEAHSTLKKLAPGTVATSSGGYTMKAKINGADWEATAMMPPEMSSRIIGSYKDDYISFPYDKRHMVAGKKIVLGEDHAGVDIFVFENLWGAKKGEIEITFVSENSAEGKFFFTATSLDSDKTLEVTDGFFRILFK